jgi:HAD superfamily hydrolase (TIGR01662 family)
LKIPSTIKTIFFDLDNTLIDRDGAMKAGMEHWLKTQGTVHEANVDTELGIILEKDNSGYTDRYLFCDWLLDTYANNATKAKTHLELFRELQELTISYLQSNPQLISVLEQLRLKYRLMIATNGSQYIQQKKIAQSKLDSLFLPEQVYISENIGYNKPQAGFYEHILKSLNTTPEECLMVGDNYANDIEGAKHCGLYTCWIDHKQTSAINTADLIFKNSIETAQWLLA